MKTATWRALASLVLAVSAFTAFAAPAEKGEGKRPAASAATASKLKIDRTSRPKRVDAGECVNKDGAVCRLSVRVAANCAITVSPDSLFIRQKGATVLLWEIQSADWGFEDRDGIKFKTAGPFDDGHAVGHNGWMVQHRSETPGVYRYGLNVVDGKGQKCSIDPVIVDDW